MTLALKAHASSWGDPLRIGEGSQLAVGEEIDGLEPGKEV